MAIRSTAGTGLLSLTGRAAASALLIGSALVLIGCRSGTPGAASSSPASSPVSSTTPLPTIPPAPKRASDFRISLYGGSELLGEGKLQLSSILAEGRPVVLNFWAGACPPCRKEMPDLQQVYELNKDRITLVGVDGGPFLGLGTAAEAEQLVLEMGVTYPTGAIDDPEVMQDYGVLGLPITYFIKPDGEIVARRMGLLTREKLDSMVEVLLARSGAP